MSYAGLLAVTAVKAAFLEIWKSMRGHVVDLDFSILMAVPKKKTTLSRKRKRAANKSLSLKQNITTCATCGTPKLNHCMCWTCYRKAKSLGLI